MTQAAPVVAILEPAEAGHRLEYVRHVARAAHATGAAVHWITTARAASSVEYRHNLADLDWLEVAHDESLDPRIRGSRRVRALMANPLFHESDLVVVLDGDPELARLVLGAGRANRKPAIHVLLMRSQRHEGARSAVRHAVKRALCALARRRSRLRVYCLYDFVDLHRAARFGVPVQDPMVVDTERPRVERSAIRSDLGLPDGRLVGMFGVIDERKSPLVALSAVRLAARTEPTQLVVAGRVAPQYRDEMLRAREEGVIAHLDDGFVGNEAMDSLMAACDAVMVLNTNPGPSGILKRAAALGVPSLVAGSELTGRVVRELGWGTASPLDSRALAAALPKSYGHVVRPGQLDGPLAFGSALISSTVPAPRAAVVSDASRGEV